MALRTGSLVSSIVQKAVSYDQKVINESVEKLSKKSSLLKGEIYELVKQQYVNFDAQVSNTVALEQRVREVRSDYQRIASRIEQDLKGRITASCDKKEEIEVRLGETQSRIAVVQSLFDIFQAVESSRMELQSGKYVSASEHLSNAARSLDDIAKEGCEAQVFRALKSEHALAMSDLVLQLQEKWLGFVSWSPKVVPSEPSMEVLSCVELHVPVQSTSMDDDYRSEVISAMKLLTSAGVWEQRVKLFAQKLLHCVIRPLIAHSCLKASHSTSKGEIVVRLSKFPDEKSTSITQLCDELTSVFAVISHVVPREYEKEWLYMIGGNLCSEIEELVIAHRLSTSIPRHSSELCEYEDIRARTKAFEEDMAKMGLCDAGNMCKMSEYTSNVNIHFISQQNQDLLVKARSILMRPLHDTVTIHYMNPFQKLQQILPTPSLDSDDTDSFDIASLTFAFPRCAVSKVVQEFVDHLYQTLEECCQGTTTDPSAAIQLFHLARSMVDLFCAVLSSHHSATIAELPRAAAVQHNNCMYLAHHLITLGHQFHSRLPPPLNTQTSTFIDQVPLVRGLGEECFLAEMRKQSACLLEFLKSFGTFTGVSGDSLRPLVRQALQRALLHTSKLSKVYLEVLPVGIHHKAMGSLLNVLVSEVVRMVLAMEDIAAADATELHASLNLVIDKGPSVLLLTTEEASTDSIASYCKNWERLKQLAVVLNASLLEIVALWDSGKGTIAKEFTVGEARGLIKALFRNTERRAAALSKITL